MIAADSRSALVTPPMLVAVAGARQRAAVDRARRALSISRRRDPDLVALRARLQPAARHSRAAVVRPRRLLRHRRLRVRPRQFNVVANLWLCLGGARRCRGRRPARWSALFISHRRGIYYAFMTIAFGQVFWFIAIKWHTRHRRRGRAAQHRAAAGRLRLRVVRPRRATSRSTTSCSPCSPSSSWLLWRLVHSPFGRVLAAIKQNETRAALLGYNVWLYKCARLRALGGGVRARRRRCSRWRSARPTPT